MFGTTRFGYEVRYPRAGQGFVFESVLRVCTSYTVWILEVIQEPGKLNLFSQVALRKRARFGELEKHVIVFGNAGRLKVCWQTFLQL